MVRLISILQVLVWLINGLYCKVLGFVPRHEAIVARILGAQYAGPLTQVIGLGEIAIAIWIASGVHHQSALLTQIVLVAVMNVIEAIFAPDLLLFGYGNMVVAGLYVALLAHSLFGSAQYTPLKSSRP